MEEWQWEAPVSSVKPEAHNAAPADPHVGLKMSPLWNVPDGRIAPTCRMTQDGDFPSRERDKPQNGFEQCRLARAIRAKDGQEFPRLDTQLNVLADVAPTEDNTRIFYQDHR